MEPPGASVGVCGTLKPGRLLLRLLYRYSPRVAYNSSIDAVYAASLCNHSFILLDAGGASGGLGARLAGEGCLPSYYIIVDVDRSLLSMRRKAAFTEAVEASACRLPIRGDPRVVVVFNDSLHHMEDPVEAVREASRVDSSCIIITDFDPDKLAGKLLAVLEKLLGFPARFISRRAVVELLESEGYSVIYTVEGRLSSYTIAACRRRSGVD